MKKIFLIIIITVLYSCNKEKTPVTFLEKHNNTVWEQENTYNHTEFYKFSNDLSRPFEMVYSMRSTDCYLDGNIQFVPDNFEIVENLEDTLTYNTIQTNDATLIDSGTSTIKIEGDSLIWKSQAFYQGEMKFETIMILRKSNLDFNNIVFCN